jgi:membrane protease YdiL (CAAX protease family)
MALLIAHLLLAYTVLVGPWVARSKYKQLQQRLSRGIRNARSRFYFIAVTQQCLRVGVIFLFLWLASLPPAALGLTSPASWPIAKTLLITFFAAIVFSVFLFRITGDRLLRRLLKMAGSLIPTTATERWWFAIVSIGAGVSEELLFRGLLIWYLNHYFPQLTVYQLIAISAVLFGYCHLYQGWSGVVGTGVIGALFAWLYLSTGSLLLPIVVHALVDLRIVAVFTAGRLRSLEAPPDARSPSLNQRAPSI